MVYPDGGEVWCSPTSTSMVLGYWNQNGEGALSCEDRVRAAVDGVYDWIYDGHGNWPFNTAYAATLGYEGYVARFTSLARAEEYVAAGVPVIMSIAWGTGDLTGADICWYWSVSMLRATRSSTILHRRMIRVSKRLICALSSSRFGWKLRAEPCI
jgi:hypothetical protein